MERGAEASGMRRRAVMLVAAMGVLAGTQGCFRALGEALGRALAGATMASIQRTTIEVLPLGQASQWDTPPVTPFITVRQEPGLDPVELGYCASPVLLTLVEFGPVVRGTATGPGFKLQIPFPAPLVRGLGPITLMDGWLRLLAPAWGPRWEEARLARVVPDEGWERAFVRDSGWTGADGAATVPIPGGRVLWLFGDSFIGPVVDGAHGPGTAMVNNTIAVGAISTEPWCAAPVFSWGRSDAAGKPTAWQVPAHEKEWYWPASGGIIAPDASGRERLVLFMCRLGRRDASESIWNFEARGTAMVIVSNPADRPERWRSRQVDVAPLTDSRGRQVTWGGAVLDAGAGELIICGIDGTNVLDKKMLVVKAPAAKIEDFGSWRFWDGAGWAADSGAAAPVVPHMASELSVHRLQIGGRERYVMVYSELTLGPRILCRVADRVEGPWAEPVTLYECPEPGADPKLMVYSAKAHPELSRPGELLISYCVNSTEFADVLRHAEKYRPRFVRVPVAKIVEEKAQGTNGKAQSSE